MKPETLNEGARNVPLAPIFPAFAVVRVGSAVSLVERVNDDAALERLKFRMGVSSVPGLTVETVTVEAVQLKMADMANASALMFLTTLFSSLSDAMDASGEASRNASRAYRSTWAELAAKKFGTAGLLPMGLGKTSHHLTLGTALHEALAGAPVAVNLAGAPVAVNLAGVPIGKFPNDPFSGVQFGTPPIAAAGPSTLPEGVFHNLSHRKGCNDPECRRCSKNVLEPGAPFDAVKYLMPEGKFFLVEAESPFKVATALHTRAYENRVSAVAEARSKPRLSGEKHYVVLKGTGKF